jgi:hypothetical protein
MPTPSELEPEERSGSKPGDDQLLTEPSHANPIGRLQILTSEYIARHPTLLRMLEWLAWNNPGASMNP